MAKMANGPLVASITGGLGPVVFAQTRFGQVVRSKPRKVVHRTPAALAAKELLRNAQHGYSKLGEWDHIQLTWGARLFGSTPSGMFNGAFLTAVSQGESPARYNTRYPMNLTWGAPYLGGNNWRVPFELAPSYPAIPHAVIVPVRPTFQRCFGGLVFAGPPFEFRLPSVVTFPEASPPFVILVYDMDTAATTLQGRAPEYWSGISALYVP